MFIDGFEKTAFDPSKAMGYVAGKAAKIPSAVGNFMKGRQEAFKSGVRKATTGVDRAPGAGLAAGRVRRAGAEATSTGKAFNAAKETKKALPAAREAVESRAGKNNKSFASKHPFLTAGGLYLGARYALSGGEEKKQPQVQPGQY